jgi:AcrR family transcriptional regulator
MSDHAPSERADRPAPQRILAAAARSIVKSGAAAMSLSEVAAEASVSKALIHYHYHDKDSLLVRLVDQTADEVTTREVEALRGQRSPLAVDSIWAWLVGELDRGSLRVLLEVSQYRSAPVQEAARRAAVLRRATTTETVNHLFDILELRPRVPPELIAEVVVAFVDGLAMDASLGDARATRVAFDVFWLAILNLAE